MSTSFNRLRDIVYARTHGTGCILDVYSPTGTSCGLGVVHVMNGGWRSDEYMVEHFEKDLQLFHHFTSRGFTVFSAWTGSCDRFTCDEAVTHVKFAIAWVKEHADDFGVEPDRLGLVGASSGGLLALMAVLSDTAGFDDTNERWSLTTQVAALGLMFPVTDLTRGGERLGSNLRRMLFRESPLDVNEEAAQEAARRLSPVHSDRLSVLPPLMIVQGDRDSFFKSTMAFVDVVARLGGAVELVVVPDAGHNWPTMDEEVEKMAGWFVEVLG